MFTLGVIPARGGSKTIKRKNLYPLCGKPLIQYTIEAAMDSDLDYIVVSTDDEDIAEFVRSLGYEVIMRPVELAQDDTPTLPVIQHAMHKFEQSHSNYNNNINAVMTLQPTSPLRTSEDISVSLRMFSDEYDSLISVCQGIHPVKCYDGDMKSFGMHGPYDKHKHKCYTRNGAIFITRRDLLAKGQLWDCDPFFYIMPKSRSIDIDDMEDMFIAEAILKSRPGGI